MSNYFFAYLLQEAIL